MLSEQLRGAATELSRLQVLKDGTKLRIFLSGIEEISGHEALFREGGSGIRGEKKWIRH